MSTQTTAVRSDDLWPEAARWLDERPDIREFLLGIERTPEGAPADRSRFVNEMDRMLSQRGYLTERQEAALRHIIRERTAASAAAPAPVGRATVEGKVVRTTVRDNGLYGAEAKMTIRLDDGSAVWVTVPRGLLRDPLVRRRAREMEVPRLEALVGLRVRLTAEFTRSDRDPAFSFGVQPSDVRIRDPR